MLRASVPISEYVLPSSESYTASSTRHARAGGRLVAAARAAHGEVKLPRLPGAQALLDLFRVLRGVPRHLVRLVRQDGRERVMRMLAGARCRGILRGDDVGADRTNQAHVVADDLVSPPLGDAFPRGRSCSRNRLRA